MKALILAGGCGTRLYPLTQSLNKHLLPVYDKPMIYYPLATLMLAGIRDVMLITHPPELALFKNLLGNGSQWGMRLHYRTQPQPYGIAEAVSLTEDYIGNEPICLILGDNILWGDGLSGLLKHTIKYQTGATVFSYEVADPKSYGVVMLDKRGKPTAIYEKPQEFISSHAVIGLYVYDHSVADIVKQLKPSERGELEVADINRYYLEKNQLTVQPLNKEMIWFDAGTPESLLQAANAVYQAERRSGRKVACLEEIAWRQGYIKESSLSEVVDGMVVGHYRDYLLQVLERYKSQV